jgi:multicomponent Na+:H+ antiporter subunit A
MIALLILFGVLGALLIAMGSRLGRTAFAVGALAPAVTVAFVALRLGAVIDGRAPTQRVAWVRGLDLWIDLRLDGFAATMALIVAVVGVLVFAYAASYFRTDAPDLGRLAGLLVLFAGAMVGLVLADQLLVLYAFWEITSITSYLLIGNTFTDPRARAAALHALLVTVTGGLAMLGGFVVLGQAAGTYRLSALGAGPAPTGTAVTVALVLVLIGAFTKSAQYPFHAWLPGAMVAPTPVSAYLHSATMVTAGVYLVARLTPVCGACAPGGRRVLGEGVLRARE